MNLFKYKIKKRFSFILFFLACSYGGNSQQNSFDLLRRLFLKKSDQPGLMLEDQAMQNSTSLNSYDYMDLRRAFGGINAILKIKEDDFFIARQIELINNVINSARISKDIPHNQSPFKDEFLGWVDSRNQEVPLYESYSFLYITEFLYLLKQMGWIKRSEANEIWWTETLNFIEANLWKKWYKRSPIKYENNYGYFLRERIHMGSHWAGIASFLKELTKDEMIKKQADILITQYDLLLKRNLKIEKNRYVWNSTYADVSGTFAPIRKGRVIQDTSHGNHVITYILNSYEYGSDSWTIEDIYLLCNTLKFNIYDSKNNRFYNSVDGSGKVGSPGLGDGWLRLAKYDNEVLNIFKLYNNEYGFQRNQSTFQYLANFEVLRMR